MKYQIFYRVRGLDNLQLKIDELYRSEHMANKCMLSYLERSCVAWIEEELRCYEKGFGWRRTEDNL